MTTSLSESDFETVCKILIDQLEIDRSQITLDAKIEEDLSADSLDRVQIAMDVEEAFQVVLPENEVDRIITVGDLCEALANATFKAGS